MHLSIFRETPGEESGPRFKNDTENAHQGEPELNCKFEPDKNLTREDQNK